MTSVFLPVILGATVTYVPRFSPQQVHQLIRRGNISVMMAVPSMYAALARLKNLRREDFTSIQLAVSGGEPLPAQLYHDMYEKTGLRILEGYGMTETSPVIAVNQPWAHKPGTVGRPLPGVQVQVRDGLGRPLPPGREGELYVRGPLVMKEYFRKPEHTAHALDSDGWFRTGDIDHRRRRKRLPARGRTGSRRTPRRPGSHRLQPGRPQPRRSRRRLRHTQGEHIVFARGIEILLPIPTGRLQNTPAGPYPRRTAARTHGENPQKRAEKTVGNLNATPTHAGTRARRPNGSHETGGAEAPPPPYNKKTPVGGEVDPTAPNR